MKPSNAPLKCLSLAPKLPPKLLSVNQTCEALGIKRTKFYELLTSSELKIVKLGRRTLVKAEDLEAFIASLAHASTASRDRNIAAELNGTQREAH